MEQAEKTMTENLKNKFGKTLEEWIGIVKQENPGKHGDIIKFLKEKYGFTHGFANFVAHKSKGSDAGSIENKDELIDTQYKGKEHFKPLYDKLIAKIKEFGSDVEIAPKNTYVSIRRSKQFAILQAATKTRFEIGLNLKGKSSEGYLEKIEKTNSMCSHIIKLNTDDELNDEMINYIRMAYEAAK